MRSGNHNWNEFRRQLPVQSITCRSPTSDTADASGETFVIKGVQTQKISSGSGTIDPALLEFTGLSFGDTFDSGATYDFTTAYITYDLTTTAYTGDGTSVFTTSAGAQSLANFATSELTYRHYLVLYLPRRVLLFVWVLMTAPTVV